MDTVGKGQSGTKRESNINIYTRSAVRLTADENVPCSTQSPVWRSVMTCGDRMRGGREAREEGVVHTVMADLRHHTAETNTTL